MAFDQNAKHESAAQKTERQKQERLQTWAFAKLSHADPITASDCFVEYVSKQLDCVPHVFLAFVVTLLCISSPNQDSSLIMCKSKVQGSI